MSEMVERVARILDAGAYLPEGSAGILLPREVRRARAEEDARQIIAAMREPTEAMARVGFDKWRATGMRSDTDQGADIWRAMIDEALKP